MLKVGPLRTLLTLVALLAVAGPVLAQDTVPPELTLQEAINEARQYNPAFQIARNQRTVADWDVKSAYGSLVPSLSAQAGASWQGSGSQQFGSITSDQLGFGGQPSYFFSSYGIGFNYDLNGRVVMQPGQAKAARNATSADIRTAEADLVLGVTQAYLNVLLEQERLRVAREELERAEYNVRLAQGRRAVGSATIIDVQQAEVQVGRSEVAILEAESARASQRFELLRRLGVDLDREYTLDSSPFELTEPGFDAGGLYEMALDLNPALSALRANRQASDYEVKIARSEYLPSLNLFANIAGFTQEASNSDFLVAQGQASAQNQMNQCSALNELFTRLADPLPTQDCNVFAFTEQQRQSIEDGNNQFPFGFRTQPTRVGFTISLPIFTGLGRQRQVEAAEVQRSDLDYRIREQELAVQADIAAGLARLQAAYQAAVIEQRNQGLADEQLRLAREQYQLGFTSFVELVEAETVKAVADRELIAAVFAYHDNLARLEAVVGTSLRNP